MRWVSERRFLHFIEDIKNIFARKDEVPKKLSELENDIGAGADGADGADGQPGTNGKTWTSTVDNNVWKPGVYGWSEAS